MVITLDSESSDPSSNLGGTFTFVSIYLKEQCIAEKWKFRQPNVHVLLTNATKYKTYLDPAKYFA